MRLNYKKRFSPIRFYKFIRINIKMPTIISMINETPERLKEKKTSLFGILVFISC